MRSARDDARIRVKSGLKPMMLWNPDVGSRRNSLTGEFMSGCPRLYQAALAIWYAAR